MIKKMNIPNLEPDTLQARYGLLCRALQATAVADKTQPALNTVARLDELIHRELLDLARLGSPDDFAEIYLEFTRELTRFREFCADPRLAAKTVIAFGGPFSAGKSSLINALIGKKLLVVEVDPTTALPAYVLAGETDAIHALNLHHLRVPLSDEELASLTHDERDLYGSQVSRALSAAFITRRDFPWANLAFIDTPGYSGRAIAGDRTDADVARAQLSGAHAIVWVVSIKQGNLNEEDLSFLAQLDPAIPRIVVASHADQLSENDRADVIRRMRETLATRNLAAIGVFPVSARPRQGELLEPLRAQLGTWNQTPRQQRFAYRFKALFTRYQHGIERDARDAHWQLHRTNRIATLAEGDCLRDADELKFHIDKRLEVIKTVETRLQELRGRFFGELKRAGDAVGIPLPEPHEIELLESGDSKLLDLLVSLREKEGCQEPDMRLALRDLRKRVVTERSAGLMRRLIRDPFEFLKGLYDTSTTMPDLQAEEGSVYKNVLKRSIRGLAKKVSDGLAFVVTNRVKGPAPSQEFFISTVQRKFNEFSAFAASSNTIRGNRLNLLETLVNATSEKQLRRNPLPEHAAAAESEHLRSHYALLLAAVLSVQASLSEPQTRLLRLLFDALELDDIRGVALEQARALASETLAEAVRLIRDAGFAEHFIRDALVLLRIDGPLDDDATRLISELASSLHLDETVLAMRAQDAAGILDICDDESSNYLAALWPACLSRPITAAALQNGLQGGVWLLDADLDVDFPWQANDAILVFRNGATLNTFVKKQEISLADCWLINASLTCRGGGSIALEQCNWYGDYDPVAKHTALDSQSRMLTITNCKFITRNARAILVQDNKLRLTDSRFNYCGHEKLDGGAVCHMVDMKSLYKLAKRGVDEERLVKSLNVKMVSCYFERCLAARGGAFYTNNLFSEEFIKQCEFAICESRKLLSKEAGDIAVYIFETVVDKVLLNSAFRHTSVYVGDSRRSFITIAENCQFIQGKIFHYEDGCEADEDDDDYKYLAKDCIFEGGKITIKNLG
ncbi:Hypothetical protein HDN1F_13050 [gamma proteobacterium HdN1]|nr:Hypothetical protein HDN1F_13050 [gamma proteobacterium HdN1]